MDGNMEEQPFKSQEGFIANKLWKFNNKLKYKTKKVTPLNCDWLRAGQFIGNFEFALKCKFTCFSKSLNKFDIAGMKARTVKYYLQSLLRTLESHKL